MSGVLVRAFQLLALEIKSKNKYFKKININEKAPKLGAFLYSKIPDSEVNPVGVTS